MTTAALSPSRTYYEDGVTMRYPVPFRYLTDGDLAVDRIAPDGAVTRLLLGVAYTATAGATDAGGTLTLLSTVSGAKLRIRRATPRNQSTDYATNDRFPAESHEAALDRAMLIDQEQDVQIADTAARALLVPDGEIAGVLPVASERANNFLAFDGDGKAIPASGTGADAGLRADLASASAGKGIDLLGRSPYPVPNVASLAALSTTRYKHAILQDPANRNSFDFVAGDKTADVAADPGQGHHVAPASAPTGMAGIWTSRLERIRPSRFNGDGETRAEILIQRMWDLAAYEQAKGNSLVCEIDRPYFPEALLYAKSRTTTVYSDPDAGIYTQTATGSNFEKQGIAFGTYCIPLSYSLNDSPAGGTGLGAVAGGLYRQRVTFYNIVGTFQGGAVVEIDAVAYAALAGKEGAPLFLRTAAYYYSPPGVGQVPHSSGLGLVKNRFTVGGQYYVTLRDPIPVSLGSGAKFAIIDRPIDLTTGLVKRDFLNRVDDYILVDAIMEGGIIEAPTNAMSAHGGMIGCRFDFRAIRGKTGFYTNGSSYCQFSSDTIVASNQIIDDAGGGWDSSVRVGSANYNYVAGVSDTTQPFSFNEGSNNKHWKIDSVNMGAWASPSAPMGAFGSSGNCLVEFGIINIPAGAGQVWAANNYARGAATDTGETQDSSADNYFSAKSIILGGAAMERTFTCDDSGGNLRRTTFDCGYVKATLAVSPFLIKGVNMVVRGRWTSGLVPVLSTAGAGLDIDIVSDGGTGPLVAPSNAKRAFANGRNLVPPWGPPQVSSGAGSFTPTMGAGSTYFKRTISGVTAFTLNNYAAGLTSGGNLITDKVKVDLINGNASSAINSWTLGTRYQMNGVTMPTLPAGKTLELIFVPASDGLSLGLESAVLQE